MELAPPTVVEDEPLIILSDEEGEETVEIAEETSLDGLQIGWQEQLDWKEGATGPTTGSNTTTLRSGEVTQSQMLLPEAERNRRRRQMIVQEILATERTYVHDLAVMIGVYVTSLRKSVDKARNAGKEPLIPLPKIQAMFSNIETLLRLNKELLAALEQHCEEREKKEKREEGQEDEAQEDDNDCLGKIFLGFAPHFKLYTDYCKNYDRSIATLQECRKLPPFKRFLEKTRKLPALRNLDISAFLILPIQRIPRYVLLLSDLQKNTAEDHPDYNNIASAVVEFEKVTAYVNESITKAENMRKMIEIQRRIIGSYQIIQPGRMFVRMGKLVKITSKFVRECWFILCSDILVYAYEILNNLQFKGAIALGPTWIRELPDTQVVKNAFQIVSAKKTYTVFAASAEEREDWMTDIQECIDELVKKRPEFKKQRVSIRITKPGLLGNLPAMMGLTYTPEQFDATGVTSKSSTYIPSDSSIYHNDDILLSERAALGDSIPPSLAESDRAPLLGSEARYGESDGFMAHRQQHSNNSSSDVCCSTCLLM